MISGLPSCAAMISSGTVASAITAIMPGGKDTYGDGAKLTRAHPWPRLKVAPGSRMCRGRHIVMVRGFMHLVHRSGLCPDDVLSHLHDVLSRGLVLLPIIPVVLPIYAPALT